MESIGLKPIVNEAWQDEWTLLIMKETCDYLSAFSVERLSLLPALMVCFQRPQL